MYVYWFYCGGVHRIDIAIICFYDVGWLVMINWFIKEVDHILLQFKANVDFLVIFDCGDASSAGAKRICALKCKYVSKTHNYYICS